MFKIRPNILFAIADDASHMGTDENFFLCTPAFDRIVKEGALFENAFASNPKCSPSRANILTGMHSWQLEDACIHSSDFSYKFRVFPELLEETGYQTGFTGKGWAPGEWDPKFKHNPAGWEYNACTLIPPENTNIKNIDYTENFRLFLDSNVDNKPFCFWYGGFEPHRPYIKNEGIRGGKDPLKVKVPSYLPDDDIVRRDFCDYAYEIEWFDRHLGNMLELLEQRNMLDNTIVMVLSDNGMPFPRVKGQMYEQDFHLPMAFMWKNSVTAGITVKELISYSDIAPTILEACGVPIHEQMIGKSFLPRLLNEDYEENQYVYMCKERHDVGRENDIGYPVRCIRDKNFLFCHNYYPDRWPAGDPRTKFTNVDPSPTKKLIIDLKLMGKDKYFDKAFGKRPEEELFDIENDPECMTNLAYKDEYRDLKEKLKEALLLEMERTEDPRFYEKADFFDKCVYYGKGHHTWKHYINGDFKYPDE